MSKKIRSLLLFMLLISSVAQGQAGDSYADQVGEKLGTGFSNLMLGWLELPKNVILTYNQSNFALATTGGTIKGVLHSLGRVGAGLLDVISAPYPTQPITNPQYVWQKFDLETQYYGVFKPKN